MKKIKEEKFYFKLNDLQLPLPITMAEAIDHCREKAINKKESFSLFVRNKRGYWTYLGYYEPSPSSPIFYTYKLEDGTPRSVPMDICHSDPAVPKYQH